MNILFLTRRFHPSIGGVETHVMKISSNLLDKGHKITIITEEVPEKIASFSQEILPGGIEVIRLNFGRDSWFKKFRVWSILLKYRSMFDQADIIHCHDVFFWYLPFRFIFPLKKSYITFHGYETKYPPSKKAIIIRKISEKLSSGNICVGDYIAKWYWTKPDYVTYGGVSNVKKLSVGRVQKSTSKINKTHRKIKILLVGRLEKDIGVMTYLKSLQLLKKKKIRFDFHAVGYGTLRNQIRRYGSAQGLRNNIDEAIYGADLVFASSYLTILQALILKKTVVAVCENLLKEDYLKMSPFARYIYICKNSKEVSTVVESVDKASWKSISMLDGGYNWAREQTWEKVVDIYLKLWKI